MRLFFSLVLVTLLNVVGFAQTENTEAIKREYFKVNTDSSSCAKLFEKAMKDKGSDNTFLCYKGAISAAMAGYSKSKQEKIKLFTSGKRMMEQSIAKDSNNVELHFLRFTIQTNCPKALGYFRQIDSDKHFILTNYTGIKNQALKNKMHEFLSHSSYLSEEEKQKLK